MYNDHTRNNASMSGQIARLKHFRFLFRSQLHVSTSCTTKRLKVSCAIKTQSELLEEKTRSELFYPRFRLPSNRAQLGLRLGRRLVFVDHCAQLGLRCVSRLSRAALAPVRLVLVTIARSHGSGRVP